MAWVSKNADGDEIKAETREASVTVKTDGGDAVRHTGCTPGDHIFSKLAKAARKHTRI